MATTLRAWPVSSFKSGTEARNTVETASLGVQKVLAEIADERKRQDARWGEQNWPNGTGLPAFETMANEAKASCEKAFKENRGTYRHILAEEFFEALAESDETNLQIELIQSAAVIVAWIECIRRRQAAKETNGQQTQSNNPEGEQGQLPDPAKAG